MNFTKNYTKFTEKYLCEALSNTVKGLRAVRLATLLKRNPRTGVLEPAVCKCSLKQMFLNNSQHSQENTCFGVSFLISSEAVVHRCSSKQLFSKISQILLESTCVGVFFNKAAGPQNCNVTKKRLL